MNNLAVYLGFLFFLNPTVGIVDVLPDFIGALLLIYGLGKVFFLSESIEAVTPKIWGLFAVSVVKTVMMLFMGSMGGSTRVMLTFAFSVGEAILLLAVFGAVTSGLESLKIRYGTLFGAHDAASEGDPLAVSDSVKPKKKKRNAESKYDISRFKTPLCVYTVFRLVMCFLPEATELRISKPTEEEVGFASLNEFKGLLYTLILPIVCIFTVFAVIRVVKTFKYFGKDKLMLVAFDNAYEKDLNDYPTRHKRKTLKTAYVMFMISVSSCIYFFADSKDMLPKVLTAAAFAVLFGYFGRNLKEKLLGFGGCCLLALSSLLYYGFAQAYFSEYLESNAVWLEGAKALYTPLVAVMAVQASLIFALLLFGSVLVRRCAIEVFSSMDDTETTRLKIKRFKRQMTVFRLASFAFCLTAALYAPLRPTFQMILTVLIGLDIALVLSAYFVDLKL